MAKREKFINVIINKIIAKIQAQVDSLNVYDERCKGQPSKSAEENALFYDLIIEVVKKSDHPLTIDEIFTKVNEMTKLKITLPKIRAIIIRLTSNGIFIKGIQEDIGKATYTFAD